LGGPEFDRRGACLLHPTSYNLAKFTLKILVHCMCH